MRMMMAMFLLAAVGCADEDNALVAEPATGTLEVLDAHGVATGDFGTAILRDGIIQGTTVAAFSIATADLDGDGIDELLAATLDGVLVLEQDGTRLLPLGWTLAIEVGDLDGDGRDDLVAMTREGIVAVVGEEQELVVRTAAFEVADVDGDGDDEVITAGQDWCAVFQWETRSSLVWHFPVYAEVDQISALTFFEGEIVLGAEDRLRFLRLDGSYRELPSVAVADLEVWDGGIVVLDRTGAAWRVRQGEFGGIEASGVTGIAVYGSTLYLLRGLPPPDPHALT